MFMFTLDDKSSLKLLWATFYNNFELVKVLIARNVNINYKDYDNRTALHIAVCEDNYLLSEYFILKGINVDVKDRWNKTAYDYALENKNERIISLFKKIEDTK